MNITRLRAHTHLYKAIAEEDVESLTMGVVAYKLAAICVPSDVSSGAGILRQTTNQFYKPQ